MCVCLVFRPVAIVCTQPTRFIEDLNATPLHLFLVVHVISNDACITDISMLLNNALLLGRLYATWSDTSELFINFRFHLRDPALRVLAEL